MPQNTSTRFIIAAAGFAFTAAAANAAILGQHHFTWWDDGLLTYVTPQNVPPPSPGAVALFDVDEWHLDQPQTTAWYAGVQIAGMPPNPFNPANRNGMTPGSAIPAVNNAEGFIYQIRNLNYFSGNGFPPLGMPPYSFTTPPPPLGQNDLSGINIMDTHGALVITPPALGSQFMSSFSFPSGTILDLTPGFVPGVFQDWDFNAHSGPGNFEWDMINTPGVGAFAGGPPVVFGYAMPGQWFDAVNNGWVHSWNFPPQGAPPFQVNITPTLPGFSGPWIPAPGVIALALAAGFLSARRNR